MTHHFGVRNSEQLCNPPVYSLDLPLDRSGKGDVIKGIDEFFETALLTLNQFPELIELLIGGFGDSFLQSPNQVL